MPYITGDKTTNRVWLSFPVPDDVYFIGAFGGAIQALCSDYNWEQTTQNATPQEAADYGCEASEGMIKSLPTELVTGVRVVGTNIQIRDANGTWSDAGELCVNCNDPQPEAPAGYDSLGHLCGAVTQSVEWAWNSQTDMIDKMRLVKQGAVTFADAIVSWAETLSAGVGELLPLDEVVSFLGNITELALQTIQDAQQTQVFLEDAQESLYCMIKAAGEPYSLTEAIFTSWADQYRTIPPSPVPFGAEFGFLCTDYIKYPNFLDRFRLYQYDIENDCELSYACGGGCYELDFETMPSLPTAITLANGQGSFVQGTGIVLTPTFDAGFGGWLGRANVRFTGAPVGSDETSYTMSLTHNAVSQTKFIAANFWTNGENTIQGAETYSAQLQTIDYAVTTPIESPDFTNLILWGIAATSQEVDDAAFIIRRMTICGNQTLLDWIASIDTN